MRLTRRQTLQTATATVTASLVGAALPGIIHAEDRRVDTIIDTHTHFYDPTRPLGVPWPGVKDTLLYRRYLPADYRTVAVPAGVTGTVIVEASNWLEDNQWILDLAESDPFIVGCVGNLDPLDAQFSENLARFCKFEKYRGIRLRGQLIAEQIDHANFIVALTKLADADRSLDLLCGTPNLAAIATLSKKIPHLRIILDHCAGVKIDGKEPAADWMNAISLCAKQANIFCKVSALAEATGKKDGAAPRDVAFYKPTLDALWNHFGDERVIYGSNWPVCLHSASYAHVHGLVTDYCASTKSKAATQRYFSGNALTAYKYVTTSVK